MQHAPLTLQPCPALLRLTPQQWARLSPWLPYLGKTKNGKRESCRG